MTRRAGAALIEVLVALVLLATAGSALVTFLGQTAHTMRQVRDAERETRQAAAELERLVLWDRATLLSRVGRSTRGHWSIVVVPISADLFDVFVAADTGAPLLQTTLYRPETNDAPPP
jgi:type II secretory pathway component PulJ